MHFDAADEARAFALIAHDLRATLGEEHIAFVRGEAHSRRRHMNSLSADWELTPLDYVAKVAEEVQQYLHDCHIDTTWPECPIHRRHPLWLHEGHWTCDELGARIAPLGGLAARLLPGGRYEISHETPSPPG